MWNWCVCHGMCVNCRKTKEMLIYFGKMFSESFVPHIVINGEDIERVSSFKLLGIVFSDDLTWSKHVSFMLGKISNRYFIIYELRRIGFPFTDIMSIYCSLIRSVLEYACVVWHSGLTVGESTELERVQMRVLRILYPDLSYSDALALSGLERLDTRRERMVREMFEQIKNPNHILHDLLPLRSTCHTTRDNYEYELPRCKTNRYARSFFPYCIRKKY